QKLPDAVHERVGVRLIDNQTAAAARDFAESAISTASARFAMEKTFHDRQAETFHERRINGEVTFAIGAQQRFIVHVTQPVQRTSAHSQLPNFTNDLVQRRANVATDQRQLESEAFIPKFFDRVEQLQMIFAPVKRADVEDRQF